MLTYNADDDFLVGTEWERGILDEVSGNVEDACLASIAARWQDYFRGSFEHVIVHHANNNANQLSKSRDITHLGIGVGGEPSETKQACYCRR